MDLTEYRASKSETARVDDLMNLLPAVKGSALDIGARDGFISKLLADHFAAVTALDLELPVIDHERIRCVKGDITSLDFPDRCFDLIFCAEVLEHIPTHLLGKACHELSRVANEYVLVGVPYKQDIRVGRTTCANCGNKNPPWGHVNSFDESVLKELFPKLSISRRTFVGETSERTNFLSTALMDMAGNPYGTYAQDEPCIHCSAALASPPERELWQKVCTKLAFWGQDIQQPFYSPHPNWIHVLLKK